MIDHDRLFIAEEQAFQAEIDKLGPAEQEQVMEIVTSWMGEGIQQGIQQGEISIILRQLHRRLGQLDPQLEVQVRNLSIQQVEELGEALLDFSTETDLVNWLNPAR
ncbi:MAG: DUF4351 domain-containing protein [Leptolyngbyaceae cyanobacterium RM1_406_9]|nr:DUF4351 domain-containing protein [Leptolyngbyaceae cyanobacterium RM1_406_9]